MDPLYRQTTAKFDEGGAKGLLMNNLGVYGGCRVLFDSLEVPAKCMARQNEHDNSDTIDLSFARGVLHYEISGESETVVTFANWKNVDNDDLHFSL